MGQVGAAVECIIAQRGDARGYSHLFQRLASRKCVVSNNTQTLLNLHMGQVDAVVECPFAQRGDARGYSHLLQRLAAIKCGVSDGPQRPLLELHRGQVDAALECLGRNILDLRVDADARELGSALLGDLPPSVGDARARLEDALAFAPSRVAVHGVRRL